MGPSDMRIVRAQDITGTRPWEALDLARIPDATVRLHWTDQPYIWHVNDGTEVFAVLDGIVDMHVRNSESETVHELRPGIVFVAQPGDEHVAHPRGAARILVIEEAGSV